MRRRRPVLRRRAVGWGRPRHPCPRTITAIRVGHIVAPHPLASCWWPGGREGCSSAAAVGASGISSDRLTNQHLCQPASATANAMPCMPQPASAHLAGGWHRHREAATRHTGCQGGLPLPPRQGCWARCRRHTLPAVACPQSLVGLQVQRRGGMELCAHTGRRTGGRTAGANRLLRQGRQGRQPSTGRQTEGSTVLQVQAFW